MSFFMLLSYCSVDLDTKPNGFAKVVWGPTFDETQPIGFYWGWVGFENRLSTQRSH